MPIEAVLTLLGIVALILVVLLSEGAARVVAILMFVAGVLASTSGLAEAIKDFITKAIT